MAALTRFSSLARSSYPKRYAPIINEQTMQWMYEDALFMKQNGRPKGCLCLLLCLIDGLASKVYPGNTNNKKRYCTFLKEKLSKIGHDESWRIEEKDKLIHLSEIIYLYFRNCIVHEADSREDSTYEVQLAYGKIDRSVFDSNVLIDRQQKQIIIKADWLINILFEVSKAGLKA